VDAQAHLAGLLTVGSKFKFEGLQALHGTDLNLRSTRLARSPKDAALSFPALKGEAYRALGHRVLND
jgi:hypothetical protein